MSDFKIAAKRLAAPAALALAICSTPAMAASINDNFDPFEDAFEDEILDSVAVPADSPIAEDLVINNGDVQVAAVHVVRRGSGQRLVFQATDGRTKTRGNIAGPPRGFFCGLPELRGGSRYAADSVSLLSDDGGLLVQEREVKQRGSSTYFPLVVVSTVIPNGNSGGSSVGGEILCMDTLHEVDIMRTDDPEAGNGSMPLPPTQYLVTGSYQGVPVSYVVER